MTSTKTILIGVNGDRVVPLSGDATDEERSRFAREAEGLQARAHQIGVAIGMTSVLSSAAVHSDGCIAFRFAKSSSEEFDAKGVLRDGDQFTAFSLHRAVE